MNGALTVRGVGAREGSVFSEWVVEGCYEGEGSVYASNNKQQAARNGDMTLRERGCTVCGKAITKAEMVDRKPISIPQRKSPAVGDWFVLRSGWEERENRLLAPLHISSLTN